MLTTGIFNLIRYQCIQESGFNGCSDESNRVQHEVLDGMLRTANPNIEVPLQEFFEPES